MKFSSDTRLFISLAVFVMLLLTFLAGYLALSSGRAAQKPVICPMDAMLCPGGSSVSRSGPNCEFTPCPSNDLPKRRGLVEDPIEVPKGTDEGKVDDGVMCTQEVKTCSDGSYVGRTGPNCAFAPCPSNRGDFLGL